MKKKLSFTLKNIIVVFFIFFIASYFNTTTIIVPNSQYLTQYTYYYPGDATGSGFCTGSGKCIDSFTTDENGWYFYETNGEKYLVIAAALNYCKNSLNHCGIDVNKHGIAQNVNYYDYYDVLNLSINGKTYKAMVLDACGACMWGRQDERGQELFDIFVSNGSAKKPNSNDKSNSLIGNQKPNLEHFGTSYTGDITKGWIYERFEFSETFNNQLPTYKAESNINEVIDEIFDRAKTIYFSILGDISSSNSYVSIYGQSVGERLPDYVKNAMSNPLGSQACNQSSCFGYYSSGNCSTHSGVDLTSGTSSSILAVADGKIVNVIRNSKQCQPTFLASGAKCAPGCTGNIVTIEHDINGEKWYTKYVHMASLESNIQSGVSISKGAKIGIIGTSGCSTGIHLHFEIIGPNSVLYNPEELLNGNCNLKNDCSSARMACGK